MKEREGDINRNKDGEIDREKKKNEKEKKG